MNFFSADTFSHLGHGSPALGFVDALYALLAIAREPFELCPHFKSPPSVARRELSIDLTWLAHRPKTQNPPLLFFSRISRVLGEGGDKLSQSGE